MVSAYLLIALSIVPCFSLSTLKLIASDPEDNDNFGRSVSISGDYAIVGSHLDDINTTHTDRGSAYIFERTSWNEVKLIASDAAADDTFGVSVSIDGDYAIVGASGNDDGDNSGSAYIFTA